MRWILFFLLVLILVACQPAEEVPLHRAQVSRVCGPSSFVLRDAQTGRMWYRTHVGSFATEWSVTEMDPATPPEVQCPDPSTFPKED